MSNKTKTGALLTCHKPLLNFAFNSNSRLYAVGGKSGKLVILDEAGGVLS